MPGPIYTAGRTPLTSSLNGAVGGTIQGPSQAAFKKITTKLRTQPITVSGSRVPPTLVSFQQTTSWQTTTSPQDIGTSITWETGDVIVAVGVAESEAISVNTPTVSGLTFNAIGTPNAMGNSTWMHRWVAVAASNGSGVVTTSRAGISANWGAALWQYRGSDGIGTTPAIVVDVNVKTISLTESQANSAVITVLGDWGAGSTGSSTWTPSGQTQQIASDGGGATYSVLGANWADAGTATTTSYGVTAGLSTTQNIAKVVVEVLGTTGSSATEVFGSATLSIESGMDTVGSNQVNGSAALTVQSSITTGSIVTTSSSADLSIQSNVNTVGTRVVVGSSALVIGSSLSVIGSTSIAGISAMSVQSSMTVTGSVTVKGSATLSGQSTFTAVGLNTVIGTVAQSIQSNLSVTGFATKSAVSVLSIQSNVAASGFATTFGLSALTSTLTMVTAGVVGTLPPNAVLSFDTVLTAAGLVTVKAASVLVSQSNMITVGSNTVRATSILSGESNLVAVPKVFTQGITALSIQSSMTVVGTTNTTPPSATLTSQSNMVVSASVTVKAIAALSIASNIVCISKLTVPGVVALSAQSSMASIGTRVVYGVSALTVQSSLQASGVIPIVITGQALLSIQTNMIVAANSTPPWVFPFIEFSEQVVTNQTESESTITIREGG